MRNVVLIALCALSVGCADSRSKSEQLSKSSKTSDGDKPSAGATVTVYRDAMGIPHIYAQTDADLFYGYGYQVAKDRLYQLDMFRRRAHGKLCEVLGEDFMIEDQQARIFNWVHWGQLDAQKMQKEQPERWALIVAWVNGANRRIAEVASGDVAAPFGTGPAGFDYVPEPLQPDDPIIVQKMAQFGLDLTLEFEVFNTFAQRFYPNAMSAVELFKPVDPAYTVPPEDRVTAQMTKTTMPEQCTAVGALPNLAAMRALRQLKAVGSNNWVVDGRHTANGKPMLGGDPHIGFGFSGLLYGVHLNSKDAGGTFNVAGFSFVGAPGIAMGHNEHVIWSPTSGFPDVMDMWEVKIADGYVEIAGEKVATKTRKETIDVHKGDSKTIEVIDVPGFGVIMPPQQVGSPISIAQDNREILVGWTGFKARTSNYFLELNRVTSLDEFEAAVLRMPEMSYNFVAASSKGISYRVGVEVPKRHPVAQGREPWLTMNGDDPLAFWAEERLTADQLPHSRAENRGWLATANNDPFGFTSDGRADNDAWYYGAFFAPGWRARRIEQQLTELTARGDITVDDMMTLQMDIHSNLADDLLPLLQDAWTSLADPKLKPLYDMLMGWDRQMKRDSKAALAFHAYAHLLAKEVLFDDITALFDLVMDVQPVYMLKVVSLALRDQFPKGQEILQGGKSQIMMDALVTTHDFLVERYGGVEASYQYSDARRTDLNGAFGLGLDLGTVPTDGGESTVNVAAGRFFDSGGVAQQWLADWGPMIRMVGQFNDTRPELVVNFPQGNVADEDSPHFDDALNGWVEGEYAPLLFDRASIEASAVEVFTL